MSSTRPSSTKPDGDSLSRASAEPKTVTGAAQPLAAGLYIVSTPIGNLRDITLRALDVLAEVDEVLAEDTRTSKRLMDHHAIRAKLSPYHDHNGAQRRPDVIAKLQTGARIALISDAGTPLISDPGWKLVRAVIDAGLPVIPIPGPSALLAALITSGLPSDRFMFCGFLPQKSGARQKALAALAQVPASLVFYESAKRLSATLQDMGAILGQSRDAAVARELTKLFEETRRDTLSALAEAYGREAQPKGEVVVLIGPPVSGAVDQAAVDAALIAALKLHPVKVAAQAVAARYGLQKRHLYQRALELKDETD